MEKFRGFGDVDDGYIKRKSGCCKIFISSWMDYFSIQCICLTLILTRVSCSIKVLMEMDRCCMLVRIAVRLEMHGELRVLFPQMYMDFLEMRVVYDKKYTKLRKACEE